MQSARQDLIHMAASRKKHRGEATCEEQARPNNDDEPSNHVGLCYDTVMENTLLVISPHHAGLCCHKQGPQWRGLKSASVSDPKFRPFAHTARGPTYRVTAAAPPPHPQDQCCFLVLITAAANFQSVRSSQQDIFVNLDSGGCRGGPHVAGKALWIRKKHMCRHGRWHITAARWNASLAVGDVNLCIGSTATLACFGVKLLSTMSQLYIGSAAKLLCFCVKTTKGNFKLCIGSVAKLLRNCSMDKKGNTFFYFFSIGRIP